MTSVYSLKSVAKHRLSTDFWTCVDGKVYDLTHFVDEHPGGLLILSAGGTDCTETFYQYHLGRVDKVKRLLDGYCIGKLDQPSPQMGTFYTDVCEEVAIVLEKLPKRPLRAKVLYFVDLALTIMALSVISKMSTSTDVRLQFVVWMITYGAVLPRFFQQTHALCHFQLFGPHLTAILDHVMISLGSLSANAYSLTTKGNIRRLMNEPRSVSQQEFLNRGPYEHQAIHHVQGASLNDDGCAALMSNSGLFRLSSHQTLKPHHRYQTNFLYQYFASTGTLFSAYVIIGLARPYMAIQYFRFNEVSRGVSALLSTYPVFLFAKGFLLPAVTSLNGLLLVMFGCGIFKVCSLYHNGGWMFFAQHIWDRHHDEAAVIKDWGKHNVDTSFSFWPNSTLHPCLWFGNGCCPSTLSYHLEHTLFPGVNYLHLPFLAPIVERVCAKHGITYNKLEGYSDVRKEFNRFLFKYSR